MKRHAYFTNHRIRVSLRQPALRWDCLPSPPAYRWPQHGWCRRAGHGGLRKW